MSTIGPSSDCRLDTGRRRWAGRSRRPGGRPKGLAAEGPSVAWDSGSAAIRRVAVSHVVICGPMSLVARWVENRRPGGHEIAAMHDEQNHRSGLLPLEVASRVDPCGSCWPHQSQSMASGQPCWPHRQRMACRMSSSVRGGQRLLVGMVQRGVVGYWSITFNAWVGVSQSSGPSARLRPRDDERIPDSEGWAGYATDPPARNREVAHHQSSEGEMPSRLQPVPPPPRRRRSQLRRPHRSAEARNRAGSPCRPLPARRGR